MGQLDMRLLGPFEVRRDGRVDDPPQRLRGSLQTYVGRLRRVLGDDAITTEPTGNRLCLPSECVDVRRFHQLLDAGNLQQALGLWRGDPFGSAISPWLEEHETPALVERNLTPWEQLPDPDIPELHKLTTRYPFRETLWLRLFTALRDAGATQDELTRYRVLMLDPRFRAWFYELLYTNARKPA